MPTEDDRKMILALLEQSEINWPQYAADLYLATFDQAPCDHTRTDEVYLNLVEQLWQSAMTTYLSGFTRGVEKRDRDLLHSTAAQMGAWLIECYRQAHIVGGKMHINSGQEEVASCIRLLAARAWFGPEQTVIAMWLQPGEHIEEVHFDKLVTDRQRTLNRVELTVLSGQRPETFTSPQVVEEAEAAEMRRRQTEQENQHPWSSATWTRRDGRQVPLHDIAGRDE